MGCDPLFTHGNVRIGTICSRGGRKRKPLPDCSVCLKRESSLECDGPPPPGTRRKSCDAPLCERCAISIRARGLDYCPDHARPELPELGSPCAASPTPSVRCRGVLVDVAGGKLCLVHLVLFDHWLGHAGGVEVWRRLKTDPEARRRLFREWVAAEPNINTILGNRHVPT